MWFMVGMDRKLTGEPAVAGLYGPFDTEQAAEAYRPWVKENGTVLELVEPVDPATYPWPDSGLDSRVGDSRDRTV